MKSAYMSRVIFSEHSTTSLESQFFKLLFSKPADRCEAHTTTLLHNPLTHKPHHYLIINVHQLRKFLWPSDYGLRPRAYDLQQGSKELGDSTTGHCGSPI